MRCLSPEIERRLQLLIDPATHRYLQHYTKPSSRVLEIGCGPGQYRLAVNGNYIGVDIRGGDYKEGLPRTPDILADARCLPFKDKAFDVVFFSNIFHYFNDQCEVLAQAIRILRHGGYLLIFDYSRKTLERLSREYARSSPGFDACVTSASGWVLLMKKAGLVNITLGVKSLSVRSRVLRCILPRHIYFSVIDRDEKPIVVAGLKPICCAD